MASGCFEIAGKVVAHSILHDGPGFVGLAPCLREYLATGCVDTAKELVSLDDLPDLDLKHILEAEVSNIYFFTGTVEANLTVTLFLLPPCYYGHIHFIFFIFFFESLFYKASVLVQSWKEKCFCCLYHSTGCNVGNSSFSLWIVRSIVLFLEKVKETALL